MKRIYFLLFSLVSLVSCTNSTENDTIFTSNINFIEIPEVKPKKITAEIFAEEAYLKFSYMYSFEKYLITIVFPKTNGDCHFLVYDKQTKKKVFSFGTIGHANNEFNQQIAEIGYTDEGIWIFGIQSSYEIKHINIKKTIKEKQAVVDNKIIVNYGNYDDGSMVGMINDSLYLKFGTKITKDRKLESVKLNFVSTSGEVINSIDLLDSIKNNSIKYSTNPLHVGSISPNKKSAVLIMNGINQLNILDLQTKDRCAVSLYEKPSINEKRNNRSYKETWVTDNHIYAIAFVYDSNRKLDIELHVFKHNGELVSIYHLDKLIQYIYVDENEKMLYGYNRRAETIYRYKLD